MSFIPSGSDPAFPVMAMDIFTTVLNRADNPAAVGQYLAEEIREITGATCVVFLQTQLGAERLETRLFAYHPPKRQIWLESAEGRRLTTLLAESEFAERHLSDDDTEQGRILRNQGYNRCLALPLRVGYFKVGVLLLLGLQSQGDDHQVEELLNTLSTLVALVLRNAFLYEQQELTIASRTEELRTANAALHLTQHSIDSAKDAIFWLTPDGAFAFHNRAAGELLSCPSHQLSGRHFPEFLPKPSAFSWTIHWKELRLSRALTRELTLLDACGREIPAEMSDTYVEFENREYCCAIVRDLSERKKLEGQLIQAQKMEAIGLLAGGIAHDFNNILAAILLQVGLLRAEPCMDPDMKPALAEIMEGAKRAADMTKQLLMFSRRSVMNPQFIQLDQLTGNLLKMLRRLIGENIELSVESEPELPCVFADPRMLEQVIMNLAINARDAMPRGGRLCLSTDRVLITEKAAAEKPERRAGAQVRLRVMDSGMGMDEVTQKRIFEPFFTTKELGKGTGLGLATVLGIVSQHKGWIEVESKPGVGSCFSVFLAAADQAPSPVAETDTTAAVGGSEGILIVEDEVPLRIAACACLRQMGYQVLSADNGRRALELWEKMSDVIDLVITDMVMPEGLTGAELATAILEKKPNTRIILTSGYTGAPGETDQLLARGVLYLAKPYDIQELTSAVRHALDRSRSQVS